MDEWHPLKALLQLQLASDTSTVVHLPHIIASLTSDCFTTSSHLPKWATRIASLLHAKDTGARWAGLCLAYHTALLSREMLLAHAQGWFNVALSRLSQNEPLPSLKAAIKLLLVIFHGTVGIPEFQRQITTPNVPKFASALVSLAEKYTEEELRVLILQTLAHLIQLFPNLLRPSHSALLTLSLTFLNGSAPRPTNGALLEAASSLYSNLHLTGGKVGAANLWRKSTDETLQSAWIAFSALTTAFQHRGPRDSPLSSADALIVVPLNLDRLRCCVIVLCHLLGSTVRRSVLVPLGQLVKFTADLLRCTKDDPVREHTDPTVRASEVSVISEIWKLGCTLASCLARCSGFHLVPHLPRLLSYLIFHLEQELETPQRLFFLRSVDALVANSQVFHSASASTRLSKVVLPLLSVILTTSQRREAAKDSSPNKTRKGKKRARVYVGDEIFRFSKEVICPTVEDGAVLLVALDVLKLLLRNDLHPGLRSIVSRVLLAIMLELPHVPSTLLSADVRLHETLQRRLHEVTIDIGSGTTSVTSKSLGLVVRGIASSYKPSDHLRDLELLLHPRMPPLLRSLPHVENFSLFRFEESGDEIEIRKNLGLRDGFPDDESIPRTEDVLMEDDIGVSVRPEGKEHEMPVASPAPTANPSLLVNSQLQTLEKIVRPMQLPIDLNIRSLKPQSDTNIAPRLPAPTLGQQQISHRAIEDDDEMPEINMESDSDDNSV